MSTEWLGVQYGLIFGNYQYGQILGPKIKGVPWLIGANWVIVVFCTGMVARELTENLWFRALLGTAMMVFFGCSDRTHSSNLDFGLLLEVKHRQNYLGWALVGFPCRCIFIFLTN